MKNFNLKKLLFILCFPCFAYSNDFEVEDLLLFDEKPAVAQKKTKSYSQPLSKMEQAMSRNKIDAVKKYRYSQYRTFKIKMGVFTSTIISLPKDEKIISYSVGDGDIFDVQNTKALPNILTINAKSEDFITNLVVITDKEQKIYNFVLQSYKSERWVVPGFTYYILKSKEEEKEDLLKSLKNNNKKLEKVNKLDDLNTSYTIKGDDFIAPKYVYDDGKFTYMDFGDNFISDRMPTVYKVVNEYDSIINKHMEGNVLIVETLSPEGFTLKNGDSYVCIKPKKNLNEVYANKK